MRDDLFIQMEILLVRCPESIGKTRTCKLHPTGLKALSIHSQHKDPTQVQKDVNSILDALGRNHVAPNVGHKRVARRARTVWYYHAEKNNVMLPSYKEKQQRPILLKL